MPLIQWILNIMPTQNNNCPCFSFTEVSTGGLNVSGSAVITDSIISGGFRYGGKALVSSTVFADCLAGYWHLDSDYLDSSPNNLDGDTLNSPTLDNGLLCLGSFLFNRDEDNTGSYLEMHVDNLAQIKNYSISLWLKLLEDEFCEATIFTRNKSLSIGYSVLGHVVVILETSTDTYELFSTDVLDKDRWTHIGVTLEDNNIYLFINGELNNSLEFEGVPNDPDSIFIGSSDTGSYSKTNIQEVKLYPEAVSSSYFLADYANICESFYSVGSEESPSYS